MENKFRNELEITLAGKPILLRPTFENIAATEENVGSINYLTWKFSRGIRFKEGKVDKNSLNTESAVKSIPSLSECAKIIYFNQAATKPEDPLLKKYSLEEIWAMILEEGGGIPTKIIMYLGRITAGQKAENMEELSDEQKKS